MWPDRIAVALGDAVAHDADATRLGLATSRGGVLSARPPYPDRDGRGAGHLRQAVPDDRGPDAAAAPRLAGDGGADPLPPRSGLRRDLRAGAGAAAAGLPDPQRGALLRRLGHRRDGVGGRQPGRARRARRRRLVRQVRRSAGRSSATPTAPTPPSRVRVGREGRPGAARRGARRPRPPGAGRVRDPVGDLDRRRQRRPGAERGRHARTARCSASTLSRGSAPSTCPRTSGGSTWSSRARRSR